ncbi:MAG: hypothetical protein WC212_00455 [Candidatus Delongbacteria bacterium]
MKVRGTIKKLDLKNNEIAISLKDVIRINHIDYVFVIDDKCKLLSDFIHKIKKEKVFKVVAFNDTLLYQFYKDNQLLIFYIDLKKKTITNIEVISE